MTSHVLVLEEHSRIGIITIALNSNGWADKTDARTKGINEVVAPFTISPFHRTLLLWSLTLMMRSFLRRSQTAARPLGLADARMCWT